jgi:rubredoxin
MSKPVECQNCGEEFDATSSSEGYWVSQDDVQEVIDAVEAGEDAELIGELLTDNYGVFAYRCDACGFVFGNGDAS